MPFGRRAALRGPLGRAWAASWSGVRLVSPLMHRHVIPNGTYQFHHAIAENICAE
jgi:hypothetical protein